MVDLRGHARDPAWMAPPDGAPALDLSSPATRPATDSRLGPDRDRTAGHREPTLGLPPDSRGAAAPWLPSLGQHHRQGPARQRPPAGTATGLHHLAVVPTPAGSRHRGLRLPHRGHRIPATAVGAVLHPASQPACASRRRHRQPNRCLGRPASPQPRGRARSGGHCRPVPDPRPRQQFTRAFDDSGTGSAPRRGVRKYVHAACRWYSWSRPPSRSRRSTRR